MGSSARRSQEEYHLFADVDGLSFEASVLLKYLKPTMPEEEKKLRIGVISQLEL